MATENILKSCPYNERVDCDSDTCDRCGWNPVVEKMRKETILGGAKQFKVPFTGYHKVWAKTPGEAIDKVNNREMFFSHCDLGTPVCLEKEDANE